MLIGRIRFPREVSKILINDKDGLVIIFNSFLQYAMQKGCKRVEIFMRIEGQLSVIYFTPIFIMKIDRRSNTNEFCKAFQRRS